MYHGGLHKTGMDEIRKLTMFVIPTDITIPTSHVEHCGTIGRRGWLKGVMPEPAPFVSYSDLNLSSYSATVVR